MLNELRAKALSYTESQMVDGELPDELGNLLQDVLPYQTKELLQCAMEMPDLADMEQDCGEDSVSATYIIRMNILDLVLIPFVEEQLGVVVEDKNELS